MAHVGDLVLASYFFDVVNHCWLIKSSHLLKVEVPVCFVLGGEIDMLV